MEKEIAKYDYECLVQYLNNAKFYNNNGIVLHQIYQDIKSVLRDGDESNFIFETIFEGKYNIKELLKLLKIEIAP